MFLNDSVQEFVAGQQREHHLYPSIILVEGRMYWLMVGVADHDPVGIVDIGEKAHLLYANAMRLGEVEKDHLNGGVGEFPAKQAFLFRNRVQ